MQKVVENIIEEIKEYIRVKKIIQDSEKASIYDLDVKTVVLDVFSDRIIGTPLSLSTKVQINENIVCFLDTYGDEDDDGLSVYTYNATEEFMDDEFVLTRALGFCIAINEKVYCFDINVINLETENFKMTEENFDYKNYKYDSKRAFYHFRNQGLLSLRGYIENSNIGSLCEISKEWSSGLRTSFKLIEVK